MDCHRLFDYTSPHMRFLHISMEHIICASQLDFGTTEGAAGEDMDTDDIIHGGTF